jgi:thiamine monophosphate synthase
LYGKTLYIEDYIEYLGFHVRNQIQLLIIIKKKKEKKKRKKVVKIVQKLCKKNIIHNIIIT